MLSKGGGILEEKEICKGRWLDLTTNGSLAGGESMQCPCDPAVQDCLSYTPDVLFSQW